jgi:hypothetical protein
MARPVHATGRPRTSRPDPAGRLEGRERREWEASVLGTPGLKGSRMLVLRTLLDEFAWGKCWCFPGNELLARKCGLGTATVNRALRDLAALGVIRLVAAKGRRRIIVFPSHPAAAAYLAGLGIPGEVPASAEGKAPSEAKVPADRGDEAPDRDDQPAGQSDRPADHFDRRSVLVNPGSEAHQEPARGEIPRGPNEPTRGGEPPKPRRLRGIPDLACAPADDPVIAGELARRARAQGAAPAPSREEIIASALGAAPAAQDGPGDASTPGADGTHLPAPEPPHGGPGAAAEAATIEALSRLGPGATRGEVLAATLRLAALFRDPGSRAFYRSVCNEVARGELPARVPVAAVGFALGPDVRHPARAFVGHIKRCRAAAESRRVSSNRIDPG